MNETFTKQASRTDLLREIELYNMAIQKQDPTAKFVALDGIDMIHFLTLTKDNIFDPEQFKDTYDLWISGWTLEPINGKLIINIKALRGGAAFVETKATERDIEYTVPHDVLSIEHLRTMCFRLSMLVKFKLT
jgi:hypothetical protein